MSEDEPRQDYAPEPDRPKSLEENIRSGATWLRLLFMVIILLIYGISRIVTGAVILLQFFFVLFTGRPKDGLLALGQSLATYTYQIVRYLTFNSEQRPFPFDLEWPPGSPEG